LAFDAAEHSLTVASLGVHVRCAYFDLVGQSQEKTMISHKILGVSVGATVAAGAMLLTAATANAAMAPAPGASYSNPNIQLAWCAAGLHVGPLGACIAGGPGYRYGYGWRRPGYWGPGHCWRGYYGRLHCN
jgi:hypothetical protein